MLFLFLLLLFVFLLLRFLLLLLSLLLQLPQRCPLSAARRRQLLGSLPAVDVKTSAACKSTPLLLLQQLTLPHSAKKTLLLSPAFLSMLLLLTPLRPLPLPLLLLLHGLLLLLLFHVLLLLLLGLLLLGLLLLLLLGLLLLLLLGLLLLLLLGSLLLQHALLLQGALASPLDVLFSCLLLLLLLLSKCHCLLLLLLLLRAPHEQQSWRPDADVRRRDC